MMITLSTYRTNMDMALMTLMLFIVLTCVIVYRREVRRECLVEKERERMTGLESNCSEGSSCERISEICVHFRLFVSK